MAALVSWCKQSRANTISISHACLGRYLSDYFCGRSPNGCFQYSSACHGRPRQRPLCSRHRPFTTYRSNGKSAAQTVARYFWPSGKRAFMLPVHTLKLAAVLDGRQIPEGQGQDKEAGHVRQRPKEGSRGCQGHAPVARRGQEG